MVERKRRKSRAAGTGGKNGADKETALGPELSPQEANRALVLQRIEELTLPILEKYGEPAFEEILGRLQQVIDEYTTEVQHLFSGLVEQAKEDHDRLRGLLVRDEVDTESDAAAAEPPADENMSEFERRLESGELASKDAGENKETD